MEKCSLHSKVAVLFARKLGQEQTIDGKRGDRASEFALHGQNTEKLLINTCIIGNAYDVDAYKNEVALLGYSNF